MRRHLLGIPAATVWLLLTTGAAQAGATPGAADDPLWPASACGEVIVHVVRGSNGPAYHADLDPIPAPRDWFARPIVWGAAVAAGVVGYLVALLGLRRRRVPDTSKARG